MLPALEVRERSKFVENLFLDLKPHVTPRTDWRGETVAPRSLGDDKVTVELWFLAGYFLLSWHDWHMFLKRYERHRAKNEEHDPLLRRCKRIDKQCLRLAEDLRGVQEIDEPLSRIWKEDLTLDDPGGTMFERRGIVQIEDMIRRAVHAVIQHHRCWQLMHFLRNEARVALPRCWKLVHQFNETRYTDVRRLDDLLDGKFRYHLRLYRRSELLFSWLDDLRDRPSVLTRLLSEEIMIPHDLPYHIFDGLEGEISNKVRQVIERVRTAIAEMGFDEFIDEMVLDESLRHPNLLQNVGAINMIPRARFRTGLVRRG
jgi:hypothetical protein